MAPSREGAGNARPLSLCQSHAVPQGETSRPGQTPGGWTLHLSWGTQGLNSQGQTFIQVDVFDLGAAPYVHQLL